MTAIAERIDEMWRENFDDQRRRRWRISPDVEAEMHRLGMPVAKKLIPPADAEGPTIMARPVVVDDGLPPNSVLFERIDE